MTRGCRWEAKNARPRLQTDLLAPAHGPGPARGLRRPKLERRTSTSIRWPPSPASFVGRDWQQRHCDLVWRVGFRDDRRRYLVLLLEFQATVDPEMAARMFTHSVLLYQRLDAEGVLRELGALPPVLPVVFYNGRQRWTAPVEMADLIAEAGEGLAPYRPSQRYYLLDGARMSDADLPRDNLVSALIGVEKTRDAARLREALASLSDLLAGAGGRPLDAGVRDVAPPRASVSRSDAGGRAGAAGAVAGDRDNAGRERAGNGPVNGSSRALSKGWRRASSRAGRRASSRAGRRASSRAGRRASSRGGRCSAVRRLGKFDAAAAEMLAAALTGVTDPERLGRVGDWIIECATASELLARVRGDGPSGG